MKNPFKKKSIVDTVINVGIGGAANVAMDFAFQQIPMPTIAGMSKATVENVVKIAAGAIGGSMVSNKYARAGFDGVATVGASNLISGLIAGTSGASGLPYGTIGRAPRAFRRAGSRRVCGTNGVNAAVISK